LQPLPEAEFRVASVCGSDVSSQGFAISAELPLTALALSTAPKLRLGQLAATTAGLANCYFFGCLFDERLQSVGLIVLFFLSEKALF